MMFHPDKCKVVTIKHKPSPLAMLPFVAYHYHLAENLLSYADSERDLGVHVNNPDFWETFFLRYDMARMAGPTIWG